ncbi:hypothetical protein H4Q26_001821 [Puccinia striiformis f. sp. tritici PST-130]|nr:hypothetical protein H4Q26_001821 [Puccinia striiformis f. sp. tritici PST-130]
MRDDTISQLMAKVKLQEAELAASPKASKLKSQPMVKIQLREAVTPPNSASDGNRKSAAPTKSNQSTPCQPKRNVTPKTDSPKVNPLQMISRDMPESFSLTRDALYVHIKLIWNLLEQKAIPSPPHPNTILEFTSRFSNADEIERTANDTSGAALIPVKEVVTFKDIKNLCQLYPGNSARLGIRVWAPDLEDLPDSLYNEACRQAALKSFRQASVGGAYAYMNVNLKYATDLTLLIPAYNHYVHYLQATRYNREKNQTGKFRMDEERKVISKQGSEWKACQRRRRFIPPTPEPSLFTKPPKGQPLDFYNPEWFNKLLPQQRINIANTRELQRRGNDLANTSGDDDEEDDEDVDFDILEDPMDLFDPDQEQEEDDGGDNGRGGART